jgi:hypothetical protein
MPVHQFKRLRMFSPGMFEAIRDTPLHRDATEEDVVANRYIKQGTRINVFSAGHSTDSTPSDDWLELSQAKECNPNVVPEELVGWIGVRSSDFRRLGDIPKPDFIDGKIINCPDPNSKLAPLPTLDPGLLFEFPPVVTPTAPDAADKKQTVSLSGKLSQENDPAGTFYVINAGSKGKFVIRYLWQIPNNAHDSIQKLIDAGETVRIQGMMGVDSKSPRVLDVSEPVFLFSH